jgi:hypothetical protein
MPQFAGHLTKYPTASEIHIGRERYAKKNEKQISDGQIENVKICYVVQFLEFDSYQNDQTISLINAETRT